MSPSAQLRQELQTLSLVAAGAIPGALLRWQLELLLQAEFTANMLGCLVMGAVLAKANRRPRLMLLAGIGFCGSLTTFSSWMLRLVQLLQRGAGTEALTMLLLSLAGGLLMLLLGQQLMGLLDRHR